MGDYEILNRALDECIRQQTLADRVPMLVAAFKYARTNLDALDKHALCKLAVLIEPENKGAYRVTPASFRNGSTALNADLIPRAMDNWLNGFADDAMNSSGTGINILIKEFLDIHPFVDGNGRTAWILYNWLMNTWSDPLPLPRYYE